MTSVDWTRAITVVNIVQEWRDDSHQAPSVWAYNIAHDADLLNSAVIEAFERAVTAFRKHTKEHGPMPAGWDGDQNHSEALNSHFSWYTIVDIISEELALFRDFLKAEGLEFLGEADRVVVVDNDDFKEDEDA